MLVDAEFDSSKQEMIHNGVDIGSLSSDGFHKKIVESRKGTFCIKIV